MLYGYLAVIKRAFVTRQYRFYCVIYFDVPFWLAWSKFARSIFILMCCSIIIPFRLTFSELLIFSWGESISFFIEQRRWPCWIFGLNQVHIHWKTHQHQHHLLQLGDRSASTHLRKCLHQFCFLHMSSKSSNGNCHPPTAEMSFLISCNYLYMAKFFKAFQLQSEFPC